MLQNINTNPLFTRKTLEMMPFENHPMTILDIGSAGGISDEWNWYKGQKKVIGFEPNKDEFDQIKQTEEAQTYPYALGKENGTQDLHITKWPQSTGMYPANTEFTDRFANGKYFEILETIPVKTVTLDHFNDKHHIKDCDVMKLDTEGSELDILKGGESLLSQTLMIDIEVGFQEYHTGRPFFSDVDQYLRLQGFHLYDLFTYRHSRQSLPPVDAPVVGPSMIGQVMWGQALYMRDFIGDHQNLPHLLTRDKLLKTACLFDMYSLFDCAVELIEWGMQEKILHENDGDNIDLLVPKIFDGRAPTLERYRKIFSRIKQP